LSVVAAVVGLSLDKVALLSGALLSAALLSAALLSAVLLSAAVLALLFRYNIAHFGQGPTQGQLT
jgi:hypothetical protein